MDNHFRQIGLFKSLMKTTPIQLKMETTPRSGKQLLLYLGQTQTHDLAAPATAASGAAAPGGRGTRRPRRPTSYQPPLVQCHVDPGRHIVTNELFPMVSAMLTARGDGNGGNVVASAAEILGLAVLLSVVGSVSWLRD